MPNGTELPLPLDIPEQPEAIAGQKIGYARVSSKDQNLERQIAALKKKKSFAASPTLLVTPPRTAPASTGHSTTCALVTNSPSQAWTDWNAPLSTSTA